MKKIISVLLILCAVLSFAACSGNKNTKNPATVNNTSGNPSGTGIGIREKYDANEYEIYMNVMNSESSVGKQLEGKTFTKEGVFGVIYDSYKGNIDRYYVWGYADNTKCCCYQWEFQMPEGVKIPESGSYVKITGTLSYDADKAMDGYWFTDVKFDVIEAFEGAGFDYDLCTLSPTLTMVEISRILYSGTDHFLGKTVRVFGRQYAEGVIQHPYYDNSWILDYNYNGDVPPIGAYITVSGVLESSGETLKLAADSLVIGE